MHLEKGLCFARVTARDITTTLINLDGIRTGDRMKVIKISDNNATITISFDDLAFLHQGMREMLQALSDRELRARTGETRVRARALMEEIEKVCEAIDDHQ